VVPARRRLPGRRRGGRHRPGPHRLGRLRRPARRRRRGDHPGPRSHAELRRGSSARGAIDLVAITAELDALGSYDGDRPRLVLDAALLALSARIGVDEASDATRSR